MSFKKTLLLGAILAGLLSYIYYVELPKEKEEVEKRKFLKNYNAESIESISIVKGDAETVIQNTSPKVPDDKGDDEVEGKEVITKDSISNWKLKDNPKASLEQSTLNAFISSLLKLDLGSPISKEEIEPDISSYGLASPRLTLKVKGTDGENSISWGKSNEYTSKDYVRVNDDVFLVPSSLFTTFNKNGDDLRDKSPVKFSDGDVSQIEVIQGKEVPFTIKKLSDGRFRLLKPYEAPASEESVSELLRVLKTLRADKFIDADPKKYGFDKPIFTSNIILTDPKPSITVSIASVKGDSSGKNQTPETFYFQTGNNENIYQLSKSPTLSLIKGVEEYLDNKPFSFSTFLVEKLEIESKGNTPLVFEKKDAKWMVSGKVGDEKLVTTQLGAISTIDAHAYVSKFGPIADNPDEAYGFGDPRLKISIKLVGEGVNPSVFIIGSEAPKSMGSDLVFASKEDKKDPFLLSKKALETLSPKIDTLLEVPSKTPTP